MADGSAGLDTSLLRKGTDATLTGIVGQRASRKGALDGYRLWVRDAGGRAPDRRQRLSASPSLVGIAERVRHAAGPSRDDRSCAPARGQARDRRGHRDGGYDAPRCLGPADHRGGRHGRDRAVPRPCRCLHPARGAGPRERRGRAGLGRAAPAGGRGPRRRAARSPRFAICGRPRAPPPSGASSAFAGRSPTSTGRATAGPPSLSPTASASHSSACRAAASRHRRSRKAAGPPSRASSSDRTPRRRTSGSRSCLARRATSSLVRPARSRPRLPRRWRRVPRHSRPRSRRLTRDRPGEWVPRHGHPGRRGCHPGGSRHAAWGDRSRGRPRDGRRAGGLPPRRRHRGRRRSCSRGRPSSSLRSSSRVMRSTPRGHRRSAARSCSS